MSHQGETTPGGGNDQTFAAALQSLKQDGCTLLVVGTAPDFVSESVCQDMLGDSSFSTRRRLIVATDGDLSDACARLSTTGDHVDPTTVQVLSFHSTARTATTQSPPQPTAVPVDHVSGSTLTDLGIAVSEAITEFEAQESDLDPAELRVCLDSLTPLADYDRKTLFQFLDLLNSRIRRASGMGHMHLPIERDTELVHLLEPLFDAVVELRVKNDQPQQRWHIPDADIQSGWITKE